MTIFTCIKRRHVNAGFLLLLVLSCTLLMYIAGLLPVKPKWELPKDVSVSVSVLPSISDLHSMSHKQLATLYHRYVNTVQVLCRRNVRVGKLGDGGWQLCEDREFMPTHPCLVYSFGIKNDFSFDDQMAERYHCDVYSFDPSMLTPEEGQRGARQWFYQVGLSERTETLANGWNMSTLTNLKNIHGHKNSKMDVLKMDIERFEWLSLTKIYETGGLTNVRQLLIEFHMALVGADPERLEYIQGLGVLKLLYDSGFRIFHTHRNTWCAFLSKLQTIDEVGCHEIAFVHIPQN